MKWPNKRMLALFKYFHKIRSMEDPVRSSQKFNSFNLPIWSALPANTRGMILIGVFAAVVSISHLIARDLSQKIHPIQVAFFRTVVPLIILTPVLMQQGEGWWRTTRPGLQIVRGIVGGISMLTWFYALSLIPVADATALSFTVVIFASLGAVLFLKERMGKHRRAAIAIGIIGTFFILKPGTLDLNLGALIALVSSFFWAIALLTVKVLARTDSPLTIVFYSSVYFTILAGIPAAYFWTEPNIAQLGLLICVGIFATIAQLSMTEALKVAETTAIMPIDFTRLLWAAAIGYLWFGEFPDIWTWIGGVIIFSSSIYITYRENRMPPTVPKRTISDDFT